MPNIKTWYYTVSIKNDKINHSADFPTLEEAQSHCWEFSKDPEPVKYSICLAMQSGLREVESGTYNARP